MAGEQGLLDQAEEALNATDAAADAAVS